ncbi:hypothetical protein [Streptomyces sp. NPDC004134]|uniref:hypothetical protein n=1 Tax=Streptomyces sp. NPDC004134 TaxID=3364691 RepID=UPI00369BC17D
MRRCGRRRHVHFQDRPYLKPADEAANAAVIATYDNALPAAVIAPYGEGRVAVVVFHPDAGRG